MHFHLVHLQRFKKDIYTKMYLAHSTTPVPRLFIKSNWEPPIGNINYNLKARVNAFVKKISLVHNKSKRTRSNMLPFQRRILSDFRTTGTHLVLAADKNLGPCVIERATYIQRALADHLTDTKTYNKLTKLQATTKIENLHQQVVNFIGYYKRHLRSSDIKFLTASLKVKDPFAKFYLTAKVHKTPWQTRPIVSISGSLLDGLGR